MFDELNVVKIVVQELLRSLQQLCFLIVLPSTLIIIISHKWSNDPHSGAYEEYVYYILLYWEIFRVVFVTECCIHINVSKYFNRALSEEYLIWGLWAWKYIIPLTHFPYSIAWVIFFSLLHQLYDMFPFHRFYFIFLIIYTWRISGLSQNVQGHYVQNRFSLYL